MSENKQSLIKAKDIMSEYVVVIRENMKINEVAHLMLRDRVSGFPVVDATKKVVGIITLTDLFKMIDEADHAGHKELDKQIDKFKSLPVSEVMSRGVISISPSASLEEIISLYVRKRVHTFPVMEDNKLVGIIGRHDILNATFHLM